MRRLQRGDFAEARAFKGGVEAVSLARPHVSFRTDVFVAVVPRMTVFFEALIASSRWPWQRHAVVVVNLAQRAVLSDGRAAAFPAVAALVGALSAR
jgi:hypothetical protein